MRKFKEDIYLTPRQREIMALAAKGKTYMQIASNLRIGEETVRRHLATIRVKFNVQNTTGAVVACIKNGLIVL